MRKISLFLCIYTFLFLSACDQHKDHGKVLPGSKSRIALDSIKALGSKVMELRVKDSDSCLKLARQSLRLAQINATDSAWLNAYSIMGNAWSYSMTDSAFYYYSKALNIKPDKESYPEKPMLLYNIAMLHVASSHFKNAIILLDSALQESEKYQDYRVCSNALNALGNIYNDLGNDSIAKKMYDSAFQTARSHQLPLQTATALGNLAKIEQDPVIAGQQERMAIQTLKNSKDGTEQMASIYINYGSRMTDSDSAIACYRAAINMINKDNAPLIMLAAYNNLVYSYLEKGDIIKARMILVNFAFPLAKEIHNDSWIANLYDTYADVLSAEGKHREATIAEKKALELSGQADKQAADKQVRLLGAMLDLKNKEAMVRAAQQESEQTKSSYATARLWFVILILLALFITAALAFMLVRNLAVTRGKLISAAKRIILVEENEKASLGRDLHDLTGHKLLNVTNFMETASFADRNEQNIGLGMMADLQDQLRKLSHKFKRSWLEKFTVHRNLEAMCREMIRYNQINLTWSQPEHYPELPEDTKLHLYRIVQELLTNAVKYSRKARIVLDISLVKDHLELRYADDGPGFDPEKVSETGIGIVNIQERIRLLDGKVVLDTRPGFGVSWEISIPLNQKKSFLDKLSGGRA